MAEEQNVRILLTEDDPNLGSVLEEFLAMKDYDVTRCTDGEQALLTVTEQSFDLLILDIMLPKKDGFTLAKEIRRFNTQVPIIFLTARSRVEDKVEGFEAGGDDYLTKPFSMDELQARIQAVLKRTHPEGNKADQTEFNLGRYHFDFQKRLLHLEGGQGEFAERKLTSREADLLKLLSQHANNVVRRDTALKLIWGDDSYFNARSMDVFISKLRKYLAQDEDVQLMNVHGVGYKLLTPNG